MRAGLVLLAFPSGVIAVWGLTVTARRSTTTSPGREALGIGAPPYNEHLLRDFAAAIARDRASLLGAAIVLRASA